LVYRYILTPIGIKEKSRRTKEFVKRKIAEYEELLKSAAILFSTLSPALTHAPTPIEFEICRFVECLPVKAYFAGECKY